jgi:all-trans-retinol 13,14-reductase
LALGSWANAPSKTRGPEYEQVKKQIAEKLLAVLFKHFPQLEDKVQFFEASTPLSSEHNLHSRKGCSYGLMCTPARYRATGDWLRCATALPGLYLAGQDVVSCGIVGAMMGGVIAASASSALGAIAARPLLWQFSLPDFT